MSQLYELGNQCRSMSALGRTAYLDQSTIIKQGCSSTGSYCVNDLWMIHYPVGWAPGGRLLAKHSMLYYAILWMRARSPQSFIDVSPTCYCSGTYYLKVT